MGLSLEISRLSHLILGLLHHIILTKNMDLANMMVANVWMDRAKFEEAEMKFHAHNAGPAPVSQAAAAGDAQPAVEEAPSSSSVVVQLIADARKKILSSMNSISNPKSSGNVNELVSQLQSENASLKQQVKDLTSKFAALDARLASIEGKMGAPTPAAPAAPAKQAAKEESDDSDSDDLFGSDDEEDEEQEKIKAARIAAYNERKAGKKK